MGRPRQRRRVPGGSGGLTAGPATSDPNSPVLVEQVGAVDAQRLGDLMGHVTPEELWGIDEALATVLALY